MEKIARVTGIYKKKRRFGGRKPNALGVGLSFLTWGKLCVCVCVCVPVNTSDHNIMLCKIVCIFHSEYDQVK